MSAVQAVSQHSTRRHLASIIGGASATGGQPLARHSYALGAVRDPADGRFIVTLTEEVPGVGITFEADSFEHAFERALLISEDMAELAGHLCEGVVVSVREYESLVSLF